MAAEPHPGRKLVRSWLFQNLSFGSLDEATARVVLESGFCVLVALLAPSPIIVVSAWLVAHSLLWILVYGGFSRIRVVFGITAPLPRLRAYLEGLGSDLVQAPEFRIALLRGSAARGELTETSDIDVLLVPREHAGDKLRGILFLWRLRVESVLARVPLQARWLDRDVFISLNVVGESPLPLAPLPPRPDGRVRWDTRGILVAVSGADPRLRGIVTRGLADALRSGGLAASCLSGVPRTRSEGAPPGKHGRVLESVRGCLAVLRWREEVTAAMAPRTAVILDGFLPDFWAMLDMAGPVPGPLRTLMVGLAPTPDVAVLLGTISRPAVEGTGSPLMTDPALHRGYSWYGSLLGMTAIDASGTPEDVTRRALASVRSWLGVA